MAAPRSGIVGTIPPPEVPLRVVRDTISERARSSSPLSDRRVGGQAARGSSSSGIRRGENHEVPEVGDPVIVVVVALGRGVPQELVREGDHVRQVDPAIGAGTVEVRAFTISVAAKGDAVCLDDQGTIFFVDTTTPGKGDSDDPIGVRVSGGDRLGAEHVVHRALENRWRFRF